MKTLRLIHWFFTTSKDFTGYSYSEMIFKRNGIKKCFRFLLAGHRQDKLFKEKRI